MATHEQLNAGLAILLGLKPGGLNGDLLQSEIGNPIEFKAKFAQWVNSGCRVLRCILKINLANPFNPEKFSGFGNGWKIEPKECNKRVLNEIDLNKVKLVSTLKPEEQSVGGEERLKRLKDAKHICLDATAFFTLWNNKFLIPEEWKKRDVNGNIVFITFDNDIIVSPGDHRYVLYLYWSGDVWLWGHLCIRNVFRAECVSAVLASEPSLAA